MNVFVSVFFRTRAQITLCFKSPLRHESRSAVTTYGGGDVRGGGFRFDAEDYPRADSTFFGGKALLGAKRPRGDESDDFRTA